MPAGAGDLICLVSGQRGVAVVGDCALAVIGEGVVFTFGATDTGAVKAFGGGVIVVANGHAAQAFTPDIAHGVITEAACAPFAIGLGQPVHGVITHADVITLVHVVSDIAGVAIGIIRIVQVR